MTFVPLKIVGKCVMDDNTLFSAMDFAIAKGFPEIKRMEPARDGVVAIIASEPSVAGQIDVIRKMQQAGTPLVAVKDAHDWLLENDIIPDFALAIDPQEHRWNCFKRKHKAVKYLIASQCHASMFEHLDGYDVTIWHPYITKGQTRPLNRMVVGGGTTSGLRAISLFYTQGWRHFALFGFDSCNDGPSLRVNGDRIKADDKLHEVRIDLEGETFYCNAAMALQAEHFQTYYDAIPDAQFYGYGHGLIQSIIAKREKNLELLQQQKKELPDNRVSFIHFGNATSASWRYRANIPADGWATLNDLTAGTLVFAKPQANELMAMAAAKMQGKRVIVDFCDDHFDWTHYAEALRLADVVTCPTEAMQQRIAELGKQATVIPDPFEYPECGPHSRGENLLWFGHAVNKASLDRILPDLNGYPLRVVSNFAGAIPWSHETMLDEFMVADIVVVPATDEKKSANRVIESIRQGCFVVAEPHPAIKDFPGIWIGDIKEGIEWALQNQHEANRRIGKAQRYLKAKYTPRICRAMWKTITKLPTTSDAAKRTGTDG